jgi:NitT/TauT family transport system ATP-binding protein
MSPPVALPLDVSRPPRPLVRLKAVDKIYDNGTVALRDLSLDVTPGTFISLLGPSGCGKSTALRIVAGLSQHSAGMIDWPSSAYDVRGEPEREIGFVFQEPQLMPWATVADNVRLPLRLRGVRRAEARERVARTLDMVGLTAFANAYPRQLSGGMKMRVSIARALVTEPKLLLMDEPFAALDEITRTRLSQDLLDIWRRSGCTVLFVTHSVYESVFLSTRVVVMAPRPGRIIGEIAIDAPQPRTADFRQSADYQTYSRQVSALLADAMGQ